ncbi:MAG: glycosyltransferase [Chthoniobacterales bacterium]|nr:glycosyltransferase [Chthoniobacterales bacterium]
MKVAYVFMGMPVGGAEDFAVGLSTSLRKKGVVGSFICLRSLDVVGEELQKAGEDITLLACAKSRRFQPFGVLRLANWLRARGIQIVQTTTYHTHTYAVPAAKLAGCKVIMRQAKTLDKSQKYHRIWTYRSLCKLTDVFVALSEKTGRDLSKLFKIPQEKIRVIPNAIDETTFYPSSNEEKLELRQKLGLETRAIWFGTVASLHEVKNHGATIEALDRCLQRHPNLDVRVALIGDGPEREKLQELVHQKGLLEKVFFAGRKRPVAPWLRAMDGFLLPSIWEGQSLALIQALSCNLPVLASRIEGNVAILGAEHPGLFSPKDTETYSGLLAQLASDGEFRTEILNSQSELNLPNWEQTVEKFWKLYLEVLKTK